MFPSTVTPLYLFPHHQSLLKNLLEIHKGIHSPFSGFHTSIPQAPREFGDPRVEDLQKMLSKKVWIAIKIEPFNKDQQKKITPSQRFLKQKFKP
jgi:hypothetical protein